MPCYHPITAYRAEKVNANGKRPLVFDEHKGFGPSLEIACGQCIGCRLDRSLDWAIRISNEASLYERNCFITLTYSPENLPPGGSLCLEHFQQFMKRLRYYVTTLCPIPEPKKRFSHALKKQYRAARREWLCQHQVRFFHCGEYGEKLGRPHYHACLLNFDFADKYLYRVTSRDDKVYRSPALEQLWSFGHSEIGNVTFASAAYVARYITKKVTGRAAEEHYTVLDPETGELIERKPEYTTMSRRPGIGAPWLEKYHKDVYSCDFCVTPSGAKVPPPRFYDNRYELMNPERFGAIKALREDRDVNMPGTDANLRRALDSTPERLKVRETVHLATINSTLTRKYEE